MHKLIRVSIFHNVSTEEIVIRRIHEWEYEYIAYTLHSLAVASSVHLAGDAGDRIVSCCQKYRSEEAHQISLSWFSLCQCFCFFICLMCLCFRVHMIVCVGVRVFVCVCVYRCVCMCVDCGLMQVCFYLHVRM